MAAKLLLPLALETPYVTARPRLKREQRQTQEQGKKMDSEMLETFDMNREQFRTTDT